MDIFHQIQTDGKAWYPKEDSFFRELNLLKKFYLFLGSFLISCAVFSSESWKEYLQKKLPPSLQSIHTHKSTQKDVEKILGKAALVEKNNHYYEMDHFKYALELTYANKTLSQMSFTFTEVRPDMAPLKLDLKSLSSFPGTGKSAGRFLKYTDKDGEILIDPTDKTIYSVRFK